MKVALYIGNHANDSWDVRLGHRLTLATQKGSRVTHGEAIVREHGDGTVDIASATLRKETPSGKSGVRIKERVSLTPGNWRIVDVPQFDREEALEWFIMHQGADYDGRGAFASVLPIWWSKEGAFFCYQSICEAAKVKCGEGFTGPVFEAMLLRFGRDVTQEFFNPRNKGHA